MIRYRYPMVLWSVEVIQLDQDVALALDLPAVNACVALGSGVAVDAGAGAVVVSWMPLLGLPSARSVPGRLLLRSYSMPSWPSKPCVAQRLDVARRTRPAETIFTLKSIARVVLAAELGALADEGSRALGV